MVCAPCPRDAAPVCQQHSWDVELFDHDGSCKQALAHKATQIEVVPTGRGAARPHNLTCPRDAVPVLSRGHGVSGAFDVSSSEGRFALNACIQQIMSFIINHKDSRKKGMSISNCRESKERTEHTQLQGRVKRQAEGRAR